MQPQAPVQVTVVEYIQEFFKNYSRRAYGKTLQSNAAKGAETLMGMLKLVLSRGGRDELRIALHCFKDQLMNAINSPASVRQQHVDEVFALLSSLVDAAERLRTFSPVKEQLSTAVLEEVRFRLYRIIVGDGFCEDVALRRRALDLAFCSMMREAAEQERSRARMSKLSSTGAGQGGAAAAAAAASRALVVVGQHAAAGLGVAHATDGSGKGPGRLRGSLQRKAAALSGPDFSSWEGLWTSLSSMAPKRMLPLLQAVMTDLYMGKLMPGTPGAAAAAAGGDSGNSSSCAATPRGTGTPPKQSAPLQQQPERVQSVPLEQAHSQEALLQPRHQSDPLQAQGSPRQLQSSEQQRQQQACSTAAAAPAAAAGAAVAAGAHAAGLAASGSSSGSAGAGAEQHVEAGSSSGGARDLERAASDASSQHGSNQPRQQQPAQQPTRFGRSSARAGHPIAAGYGASHQISPSTSTGSTPAASSSTGSIGPVAAAAAVGSSDSFSSSSSPKAGSAPAESRGAFASLASRLSGGGAHKGGGSASTGNSPASGSSKWSSLAGGFLGLQSTASGGIGSGRLIPRGWVQFGGHGQPSQQQHHHHHKAAPGAAEVPARLSDDAPASADPFAVGSSAVDAGGQQQQPDQVSGAVEPPTPAKGPAGAGAAAANNPAGPVGGLGAGSPKPTAAAAPGSAPQDDVGSGVAGDADAHGFEGDEPDWGSGSTSCCAARGAAAATAAAVHCTPAPAPAPAVGL